MLIKCDMCGKVFEPGNRPDGTPNGVCFVLSDNSKINACSECIEKVGENPEYLEDFLDVWEGENGN